MFPAAKLLNAGLKSGLITDICNLLAFKVENIKPKRILFIVQWPWQEALVQTYALPYVRIIREITGCYPYVVSVNKAVRGIRVSKRRDIVSIEVPSGGMFFLWRWFMNIQVLKAIVKKKRIGHIHPWCTTAGAIGNILKSDDKSLKLTIDSFEPHAEAMVQNGTWAKGGLKFKVLSFFENKEVRQADHLIFAASGMENYIKEKYNYVVSNYDVKPACIDLNKFSDKDLKNKELVSKFGLDGKVTCVYAGKFGGIYLEDETFEFIKACEEYWGKDKFRFLLLSNAEDEYVNTKMKANKIEPGTIVKQFVLHENIPTYMGLADFAITPVKPVSAKRYCTPIKDGEYWALGLPVVITPGISNDSDIIKENGAGAILEGFTKEYYIKAIKEIEAIISGKSRTEVYQKIRPIAEKYRDYSIALKVYQKIYG
jgi:hypothetical protein